MASTSSSRIMVTSGVNVTCYDIFLSFRGEDTRNSFTDHLYDALGRAGFLTFRDNDEIDRGQELKPEIERAIKTSKASIVVLSKNYATSTWCLDELWLILKQRRECNHFVLPVFYHVDPSDVRKQNKTFNMEVKTSTRWTDDNVNRWKTALTKIADLTGLVLFGPETKFIKDIVDTIYNKLDRKQVYLPPNLIGMDARVQEINSWLKKSDVEFLVICGMGGSGKSTLAQYIVYSNWQSFESISIVECIGSRCKEPHHLFQLQEQIFKDVLGGKNQRIPSVCQRALTIEEVLQNRKALIVLDDIVNPSQLDSLLGVGNINKESKIIITTMENDLGIWFKSKSRRCQEYKMELLDDNESLELLCLHAFGSKILLEGYEKLAKQVVRYCEGNPLALEVLGSSLSEDNSITYWESAVKLLGKEVHGDIYRILKRSYDSLPYNSDRELFLHIACFFVGMDIDYVVKILEPDYSAVSRIKTLMKRCLVFVTPNKKLMMHRLLQETGRSLVEQESPFAAKRSRVWRNMESYDMLKKGKSLKTMKGLALDMHMLMKEDEFKLKDEITRTKMREEEIYKIAEMSKSSFVDKSVEFTFSDAAREAVDISEASAIQESKEFSSTSLKGPQNVPVISPSMSSRTRAASPWRKDKSIDDIRLFVGKLYNDNFEDYLCNALDRANLSIFPGTFYQEGQTRASIIVFTKSYTSSSWYLDKLLKILDERRNSNHFVLPIFYHVEPSYIIEHGKDLLSQRFQGFEEPMKKVELWHAALKQIANMPNIYFPRWSRDDDDMAGIREIVSIVKHALYPDPINSPPNPTKKDTPTDKTE